MKRNRASELRAIADGRLMLNVRNGVTVSRSMLAMIADEIDALRAAPLTPAEAGGLVERLRETHTCDGCGEYVGSQVTDLLDEAAATLASERAAHAETKRELEIFKSDDDDAYKSGFNDGFGEANMTRNKRAEDAEARLAEALKALEAARAIIQEDRDEMFASVTVAGDASTIDEIDRPAVDRLDAVLVEINAARRAREGGNADG